LYRAIFIPYTGWKASSDFDVKSEREQASKQAKTRLMELDFLRSGATIPLPEEIRIPSRLARKKECEREGIRGVVDG